MLRPWQRIVGCAAATVLALLLSGCEVRGTVDVKSGTEAVADLVFTEAEPDCYGLTRFAGLVVKGIPDSDGDQTCRAQGTLELEALEDFGIQLTQVGEYLIVDLALPERVGYMPLEIDISFPGQVIEDGGLPVSGTGVRLGNATIISDASPARIVALSHPGPEWWVLALVGGLVSGVLFTLAGLLLVHREHRLRTALNADAADALSPADADADAAQAPSPSDAGWAPATGTAEPPPFAAPADQDGPVPDPDYHAQFAPPPPGAGPVPVSPPTPSLPPDPAPAEAEHRIWAPPEDQGDR